MSSEKSITFKELEPLIQLHVACNQVPFLAGAPGIGKSAVLKHLSKSLNTKVFVLSVNQLGTREDLTGARAIMDETTKTYRQVFFPHAIIQDCIDYAKDHPTETPLLFLDEINRTSTDVTSAIMAVITERRVGTTVLPNNIRIVAAGNDNGNINVLDEASTSRMQIYHVKPDLESFLDAQSNFNYYLRLVLTKNPDLLVEIADSDMNLPDADDDDDDSDDDPDIDDLFDDNGLKQITVPRTLTNLSNFLNAAKLDGQSIPKNINSLYNQMEPETSPLRLAITATIGETTMADAVFDAIVESINSLSVVRTPDTTSLNIPKPKSEIIEKMYNEVDSDDAVDQIFKDPNLTSDNLINTYFTLVQIDNYKKLNDPSAIDKYYRNLTALNMESADQIRFSQTFAELLRYNLVATPVIDEIKQCTDALSTQLNVLINALS